VRRWLFGFADYVAEEIREADEARFGLWFGRRVDEVEWGLWLFLFHVAIAHGRAQLGEHGGHYEAIATVDFGLAIRDSLLVGERLVEGPMGRTRWSLGVLWPGGAEMRDARGYVWPFGKVAFNLHEFGF
jgi:hypothetical protein